MPRLLLIEDDSVLGPGIELALRRVGYDVLWRRHGLALVEQLQQETFDLVILDIGLPYEDGFQLLKKIREAGYTIPVMMLTARDTLEDRVSGLNMGADDYMTKPFNLLELEARVNALLRRHSVQFLNESIQCGRIRMDLQGQRVYAEEQALEFSARELSVLTYLLQNQGKVVSKTQLLDSLYGEDQDVQPNAVEVCISRIRKKIEDADAGVTVKTIRGLGYILDAS